MSELHILKMIKIKFPIILHIAAMSENQYLRKY